MFSIYKKKNVQNMLMVVHIIIQIKTELLVQDENHAFSRLSNVIVS